MIQQAFADVLFLPFFKQEKVMQEIKIRYTTCQKQKTKNSQSRDFDHNGKLYIQNGNSALNLSAVSFIFGGKKNIKIAEKRAQDVC